MAQKPKALFVGHPQIGEALVRMRPEWEFQPNVDTIKGLWDGLEDGTIDNDIHIFLVHDMFFKEDGSNDEFETMVSTMLPYCFLGIVNYKPSQKELIRDRIDQKAYESGASDYKFYFIEQKRPNQSLDIAIQRFISESTLEETVSVISGKPLGARLVESVKEVAPQNVTSYYEDDDDEESDYLGQVVSCTSSKGGSGKSTIAVSLATYLAHSSVNSVREGLEERPLKIIILDLDVRDGQLGFLTGNSKPTVINLRLKGVSEDVIEETVIHSSRLKVDLLLAPKRPRNSDDTPPDFYVELIHTMRKMYDYIILDTSVNYLDPLLEKVAYPTSDQIVFVTDIVVNSVFSMTRWIQEVTGPREKGGMGISKNKIGIVVNKSLSNVNMSGEKIARSALGIPVITAVPSNPKLVAHAANMQSMEVLLKHKDLYPAIRRLARAVTGKKYKLSDNVTP